LKTLAVKLQEFITAIFLGHEMRSLSKMDPGKTATMAL
jgi:hypothetical protein